MSTHVVTIGLVNVDSVGNIVSKTSTTISNYMASSSEMRVQPNSAVSNSANYPTISDYLSNELADGYSLLHIDQTHIVTIYNYDPHTGGMVVQDSVHQQIHRGILFSTDIVDLTLGSSSTLEVLITANCGAHMRITAAVGSDATIEFFENPTVTAAGTPTDIYNRNRFSTKTPGCVVTSGPTVTVDGTQLENMFVPGGTGPLASGGAGDFWNEWILKTNNTYLVRLTNISVGAAPMQLQLDWYEPNQAS